MKNKPWHKVVFQISRGYLALFGWLVLIVISSLLVNINEQRSLDTKLSNESATMIRLASQRADQHDAHLTSLSAIATADPEIRRDLFLGVAETILRFYPRIIAIDLVRISDQNVVVSTNDQTTSDVAKVMVDAARKSEGSLQLRANPANKKIIF